ncbi:hypothetical protein CERZMDRAFT_99422 [Cercospora zeae-maydis SCOH1-5]|uniref:Uncharacterized protein n=1 Tax=Cercospora zeae-maydis SCOH1-5 TaxID=717836 RepID=A0A6A6FAD4_9PEZI|nr:hypothetical protein CERZMDRAFT_99422 [Cercospora zeae-maydis SCOH1-5]
MAQTFSTVFSKEQNYMLADVYAGLADMLELAVRLQGPEGYESQTPLTASLKASSPRARERVSVAVTFTHRDRSVSSDLGTISLANNYWIGYHVAYRAEWIAAHSSPSRPGNDVAHAQHDILIPDLSHLQLQNRVLRALGDSDSRHSRWTSSWSMLRAIERTGPRSIVSHKRHLILSLHRERNDLSLAQMLPALARVDGVMFDSY